MQHMERSNAVLRLTSNAHTDFLFRFLPLLSAYPRYGCTARQGLSGKLEVKEVNIYSDKGEKEAERFEVEMVPTVILEDGTRFNGLVSEEKLRQAILKATFQSR